MTIDIHVNFEILSGPPTPPEAPAKNAATSRSGTKNGPAAFGVNVYVDVQLLDDAVRPILFRPIVFVFTPFRFFVILLIIFIVGNGFTDGFQAFLVDVSPATMMRSVRCRTLSLARFSSISSSTMSKSSSSL